MASATGGSVLRELNRLVVVHQVRALTDAQLLHRFLAEQEEGAFTVLVQRYGRLVWSVCRHVLGNHHDAEDAFQATFLVLARRAGSIRKGEALASWLQGTAFRVALRAKRDLAIRRKHEQRGSKMPTESAVPENVLREALAFLDEEVQHLPANQRAAFVLCSLEGKSLGEAARQLGWKEGTVSGTLARARQNLRRRLTRRGVTLSALLTAVTLGRHEATAAVPSGLELTTVREAIHFAMRSASGSSSGAVSLAEGVIRGMLLARGRLVTALVLALGLILTGAGAVACQLGGDPQDPAAAPAGENEGARLDAFGDPLPVGAVARYGTQRLRHGDRIYSLAVSPDGKTLASRGLDGWVRLWDTASGRELHGFRLNGSGPWSATVAFSPDGKTVASADEDPAGGSVVHLWDVATGQEKHRLHTQEKVPAAVAYAPRGSLLALATGKTIHLWDPATGLELSPLTGHEDEIEQLAFSPNGKTLASAGQDRTARLWDPTTGRLLHVCEGILTRQQDVPAPPGFAFMNIGRSRGVVALAFATDGKSLAASASGEFAIRRWQSPSGRELPALTGNTRELTAVYYLPDGKTLVSGDWFGMLRFWDLKSGKELRAFQAQDSPILSLAGFPGGEALAVGGYRSVRLWDLAHQRELLPLGGHQQGVYRLAVAPDGKTVASAAGGQDQAICLWDPATGRELGRQTSPVQDATMLAFAPDGKTLLVGNAGFLILDARTGKEVLRSSVSQSRLGTSPDGTLYCYYPDKEGQVPLCDARTGRELRRLQGDPSSLSAAAFSADNRYLAGAFYTEPRMIRIWETATGKIVTEFQGGKDESTFKVLAFSPDGRTLASGSKDGTVRLWEVSTGGERRAFRGHHGSVQSLAFSPDGRRLISGGEDTTAIVWDVYSLLSR